MLYLPICCTVARTISSIAKNCRSGATVKLKSLLFNDRTHDREHLNLNPSVRYGTLFSKHQQTLTVGAPSLEALQLDGIGSAHCSGRERVVISRWNFLVINHFLLPVCRLLKVPAVLLSFEALIL